MISIIICKSLCSYPIINGFPATVKHFLLFKIIFHGIFIYDFCMMLFFIKAASQACPQQMDMPCPPSRGWRPGAADCPAPSPPAESLWNPGSPLCPWGNLPFSILSPPTKTSPASGRAKPHIIFSSTLFPEPFSPRIPQMSPRGTVIFKLVNRILFLYAFDTFRSSTIFFLPCSPRSPCSPTCRSRSGTVLFLPILPVLPVLLPAVPVLRQPYFSSSSMFSYLPFPY